MRYLAAIVFPVLFSISPIWSKDTLAVQSIFTAMQSDEVVNVTIITDLDSLIYFRKRETYQPATFIYENELGEKFTQAIKVKPRGKYRRRVCDFPTIKLDFKKKALKASGMAKYDKYKLVTHCVDDKKESRENVLREYLVYKMYNLLSPQSYRVQLINITYKDSKEKINTLERTAFLIEATKELEDRLDVDLKASLKLPIDSFDLEQYNFVALFQYMIGNVDWRATPFAKNIKIMKSPTTDAYELIPYDFDFSGVVGVSYMRLAEHLNQKNARQRIFLGHIINDQSELQKNFALFETKKEALLSLISNFELLCKPSRRSIRRYINSFYEDIADGMVATALLE